MKIDDSTSAASLFSLLGELKLSIGGLAKQVRDDSKRRIQLAAYQNEQPVFARFQGNVVIPASGFAPVPLNVGGPNQGYMWNVRRISISGITPGTVVAGRGDVFVSAQSFATVTAFNQISMADWADQAVALPLVGNYAIGELELRCPERLQIIISGATPGQTVIVNGVAQQVQEKAFPQLESV